MTDITTIAISFASGNLARMQLFIEPRDEIVEAEINVGLWPEAFGAVTGWRIVAPDEFPADQTFRAAWTDTDTIGVDMEKARDIHRDRMRVVRAPLLEALDRDYMRADELVLLDEQSAAEVAEAKRLVVEQKQVLRDVTADPAIEASATPEELRAVWPEALGQSPV